MQLWFQDTLFSTVDYRSFCLDWKYPLALAGRKYSRGSADVCSVWWLLPHWQWLYLLSSPALRLSVGELVFLMRKALSNLPPILSAHVSTDVSGSFFTLPMTQRPLTGAFVISPFRNACDVGQEVGEIKCTKKAFQNIYGQILANYF